MTLMASTIENWNYRRAEEQVVFLRTNYRMQPADIIRSFGMEATRNAHYGDAIEAILQFNGTQLQ